MSERTLQPAFPALRAVAVLTLAAVALTALALFVGPVLYPVKAVRLMIVVSCGVVWLTAVLGVLPVAMMGHLGLMPAVWGYFIGMALRFVVSFVFYLVAVLAWRWPGNPVVFALAITYVPLLFIEVGFVGRYIWQKDESGRTCDQAAMPREASA